MPEVLGDAHAAARACMDVLEPYDGKYAIVIILAEVEKEEPETALTTNIKDRREVGVLLMRQILRLASPTPADHVGKVDEAGLNG